MSSALVLCLGTCLAQDTTPERFTEIIRVGTDYSSARLQPAKLGETAGITVEFQGSEALHYYATSDSETRIELTVEVTNDQQLFAEPQFPRPVSYRESFSGELLDVFQGDFNVFIPFKDTPYPTTRVDAKVTIAGQACTNEVCTPPTSKNLTLSFTPGPTTQWNTLRAQFAPRSSGMGQTPETATDPEEDRSTYGMAMYLFFAILAGISINLMPCVLPIIPIVIMRLLEHSKASSAKRVSQGIAFCLGIILFFVGFAALAGILQATTGAVLDLNGLFRYPPVTIGLFLAITLFGLVMLDVVPLTLPSGVANRQSSGVGVVGSLGTGFFAAVLSIPCSGALLAFVLVWAQTQPILVSSVTIVLMGIGMALPYAVIILVPGLLERMPKPGAWMELFKKSCGFLLIFIAVKLGLAALPKERLLNCLMYGVLFSFCVWMWGQWVNFSTPIGKRWTVRGIAATLAVVGGFWLLPATAQTQLQWQPYDASVIAAAQTRGQPVLLKFTADWCTNCKVVEKRVFHDDEIVELMEAKNVLAIKADTTTHDLPATAALKETYGEAGNVPVTILLMPGKEPIKLRGIYRANELAELLGTLTQTTSWIKPLGTPLDSAW